MKLSIVIPYFNRKALLENVLKSINMIRDIEVIIIDDGSNEENKVDFIDYRVIRVERPEIWRGACMAYNMGFKEATGDVIMINSSECVHMGNVTGYVFEHFKEDNYFSFSTYMMDEDENLNNLRFDNFWGVHSKIGNYIPYCAVISKDNMDILGGYDERFADGVGFDDYDFTHRVGNLGLKLVHVDNPFVVHQWHQPTVYPDYKNFDLFNSLNKEFPSRTRVNVK